MSLYVDIEKNCGDFCLKVKLEAEKEVLGLLGCLLYTSPSPRDS